MIPKNTTPTILATAASLMLATQAQAHAKLVGSTPVADTAMGGALGSRYARTAVMADVLDNRASLISPWATTPRRGRRRSGVAGLGRLGAPDNEQQRGCGREQSAPGELVMRHYVPSRGQVPPPPTRRNRDPAWHRPGGRSEGYQAVARIGVERRAAPDGWTRAKPWRSQI